MNMNAIYPIFGKVIHVLIKKVIFSFFCYQKCHHSSYIVNEKLNTCNDNSSNFFLFKHCPGQPRDIATVDRFFRGLYSLIFKILYIR